MIRTLKQMVASGNVVAVKSEETEVETMGIAASGSDGGGERRERAIPARLTEKGF